MNVKEIERLKKTMKDENLPAHTRRAAAHRILSLEGASPAPAPAPGEPVDVAAAIKALFDAALDEMRERDEAEAAKRNQAPAPKPAPAPIRPAPVEPVEMVEPVTVMEPEPAKPTGAAAAALWYGHVLSQMAE